VVKKAGELISQVAQHCDPTSLVKVVKKAGELIS
jgi:hypothetical protein